MPARRRLVGHLLAEGSLLLLLGGGLDPLIGAGAAIVLHKGDIPFVQPTTVHWDVLSG